MVNALGRCFHILEVRGDKDFPIAIGSLHDTADKTSFGQSVLVFDGGACPITVRANRSRRNQHPVALDCPIQTARIDLASGQAPAERA
jgi:hypothetical protein